MCSEKLLSAHALDNISSHKELGLTVRQMRL